MVSENSSSCLGEVKDKARCCRMEISNGSKEDWPKVSKKARQDALKNAMIEVSKVAADILGSDEKQGIDQYTENLSV